MTNRADILEALAERVEKRPFPRGCGYACPCRDWVSGTCERHGPTMADRIVDRVTETFRRDLKKILGGNYGR